MAQAAVRFRLAPEVENCTLCCAVFLWLLPENVGVWECPRMLPNRRTLPDVYFLPVFKGEKLTPYTFQLDLKHLSIQVKDPGPLRSWIHRRKNIRFPKRTVSEASPALAFSERMISVKIGHFSLPRTVPAPVSSEGLQDLHCLSECALGM